MSSTTIVVLLLRSYVTIKTQLMVDCSTKVPTICYNSFNSRNSMKEVSMVDYKRSEPFRHLLVTPVEVQYQCTVNQVAFTRVGKIIDISPSGISLLVSELLKTEELQSPIGLSFCLDTKLLETAGEVRWKKYHAEGIQYEVELKENESFEQLIIEELKLRRKKEIQSQKV